MYYIVVTFSQFNRITYFEYIILRGLKLLTVRSLALGVHINTNLLLIMVCAHFLYYYRRHHLVYIYIILYPILTRIIDSIRRTNNAHRFVT